MDFSLPSGVEAEEDKDVLSSSGPLSTDVYPGTIEMVYQGKSAGGSISINIHFKTDEGRIVRQETYISSKEDAQGKVRFTYLDKQSGKDRPLPGWMAMDTFFKAVTGKGLPHQNWEEKMIKLYDYDSKKEIPQSKKVAVDALNQRVAIGIRELHEEKTTKESGYKDGTGEFYKKNEFEKYFDADNGLTLAEKAAGETEAAFLQKWKEKNRGKVRVKKAKNSGAAPSEGTSGVPAQAAPAAEVPSLFD